MDRRLAGRESATPNSAGKSAKWQPLTSVAPRAEGGEEDDPFSLGDSDDDKESKTRDLREADSARLKEAARQSVSSGEPPSGGLQERERGSISTKDKEAEALLTGPTKTEDDGKSS